MTKTIAIFNQAGGVAKSSITQNLGYRLHRRGHRILLIDMDPQASLTMFLGLEPHELDQTVSNVILNEADLPLQHNLYGMDLLANITLSAAELQLSSVMAREIRLKQAIEPILDHYDFVLMDATSI